MHFLLISLSTYYQCGPLGSYFFPVVYSSLLSLIPILKSAIFEESIVPFSKECSRNQDICAHRYRDVTASRPL